MLRGAWSWSRALQRSCNRSHALQLLRKSDRMLMVSTSVRTASDSSGTTALSNTERLQPAQVTSFASALIMGCHGNGSRALLQSCGKLSPAAGPVDWAQAVPSDGCLFHEARPLLRQDTSERGQPSVTERVRPPSSFMDMECNLVRAFFMSLCSSVDDCQRALAAALGELDAAVRILGLLPLILSSAAGVGSGHFSLHAGILTIGLSAAVATESGLDRGGHGGGGGHHHHSTSAMTASEGKAKGGAASGKGAPSDDKRAAPPKLAMPGSARGPGKGQAPTAALPAMPKGTSAPKISSARGTKKDGNPLGTAIGSARRSKPSGGGNMSARGAAKAAPPLNAAPGPSGAAPPNPSARASTAAKPKPPAAGARRAEPEPEVEKPWGLVTAPIPPLPDNIKKPPFPIISPAGGRPRGRQDGAPSRHDLAPEKGWVLLFNCFKAKFEIISGDATQLSEHDPFDLKGPRSQQSIGRIKISPEKGTSIISRVEFPNEWLVADAHGILHDAYQGEGTLDIKVEWRKETGGKETGGVEQIIMRVTPWLAYACSLGARMQMRKPGEAEGRMCTVQRVLPDDRCVVRVDGLSGADPKKTSSSAEDVVDASPSTCVPTSHPRYAPGARLLVLHEGACTHATVEEWSDTFDPRDGSRHRMWLAQGGAVFGWVTCKTTQGTNNLIPANVSKDGDEELDPQVIAQGEVEFSAEGPGNLMQVVTPQPLVMRAGCPLSTGRVGVLPPMTCVRLLETRVHDGGLRARVERVAADEDAVVITADLNEVNHSVQRFTSAAEYESARSSYCEEVKMQLEYVEDAITGSDLLIAEQVIYINTSEGISGNMGIEWKAVKEGIHLVEILIKPSKRRLEGMHSAQPCLCIAGPGTGTTWMVRQVVHSLATRLTDSDATGDGGVRLVPVIVFVQRIVRLLRETGQDPKIVVSKRRLFLWYIENEFPGKQHRASRDMLLQAYEMRALIILLDGVDEAAALRTHVEEFIHYELVPSGNRTFVTSRPEGITLPLYTTNFAIMSLRPLTESQQRRVAQSQMRGSLFYEHLVSITNARKQQDDAFLEQYPTEAVRGKLESIEYVREATDAHLTPPPSPPGMRAGAPAIAPAGTATEETEEQTAIDTLDHVIRVSAMEAGMDEGDVDVALSWLDESSADDELPQELDDIQAFARLEINSEDTYLDFVLSLMNGVDVEMNTPAIVPLDEKEKARLAIVGGVAETKARLQMLHLVNRFASFDPTHTRDVLAYLRLTYKGQTLACELQVVNSEVLRITETSDSYSHLVYFREQAISLSPPGTPPYAPKELDTQFEKTLSFAEEASGVPVLLSMFVLILVSGAEDLMTLPTSRLELYQHATDGALRRRIKRTLPVKEEPLPTMPPPVAKDKDEVPAPTKKKAPAAGGVETGKEPVVKTAAEGGEVVKKEGKKEKESKADKAAKSVGAKKEAKSSAGPTLNLAGAVAQKLEPLKGEENVVGAHATAMKILAKVAQGDNLRDSIQRYVPEGNKLRPWVKAIVEAALEPPTLAAQPVGLRMLRRIAIANQEAGRREFSSKDVSLALGSHGDELILWLRLEQNQEHGVAMIKMLEQQTDQLPAQYQFKHLSFQEGLFAEHLLTVVEDPNWQGWENDSVAAAFLNNAYMNNTCRIAAGRLGTLLAKRRAEWNFSEASLGIVGRRALFFLLEGNETLQKVNLSGNEVGSLDTEGIVFLFRNCYALKSLDLSHNSLDGLKRSQLSSFAKAMGSNTTITELNLSSNRMGPDACKAVCSALVGCLSLRYLGLSNNQPSREMALPDLLRTHASLTSIDLVEPEAKGLDSRAKDNIGQALVANPVGKVCFLECDAFAITQETRSLIWTSSLPADAVLLAGVLKTNTTLTSLGVAAGQKLGDAGRAAIGRALLQNKNGRIGFCDELGLREGVKAVELDLATSFHSVEAFLLLAGVLRANRTLTSLTINSLKTEHIEPLAEGLRSNSTLEILRLQSNVNKGGGAGGRVTSAVTLPIQLLNGSLSQPLIDLSSAGTLSRVSCAVVGVLLAENRSVKTLKLSKTGLGSVVQAEGGNVLFDPLVGGESSLYQLDLAEMELGDTGGRKIFEALLTGKCKRIKSLILSSNGLADETARMMHQLLQANDVCTLTSLDLSHNAINQQSLARAIKRNSTLRYLNVLGCGMGEDALRDIGDFLLDDECKCQLAQIRCDFFEIAEGATSLDLSGIKLSTAAARLLCGVLKFNTDIESVSLIGCGVDAEGAKAFEVALAANQRLAHLDLSGNRMHATSEGTEAITRAVTASKRLERMLLDGPGSDLHFKELRTATALNLSGRRLRMLSGAVVGALAGSNPSLSDLNLENNDLGPGGTNAVTLGLSESKVLRVLNLSDCGLAGSKSWELLTQRSARSAGEPEPAESIGAVPPPAAPPAPPVEGERKRREKRSRGSVSKEGGGDEMVELTETQLDQKTRAQLAELMVSIGQIDSLEILNLDNNKLSDAESALLTPIGKLGNLRSLSLCGNKLTEVPSSIGSLRSLTELLLRSNQLNELPNASIGLLGSLENLDLKGNTLTYLPDTIGQLRSLKNLDLSENKLTELPASLGLLRDHLKLSVSRNPLQRPPLSVARQGIDAIRRYFNELKKSGSTTSRAARLVLLGAGLAGKTSLQRGLRHGAPRPSKPDERTIQLDIHTLPLGSGAEQVVLSMWDLAGQPEYAAGLQPYIVPGSLYLLAVPAQIASDEYYSDVLGRWLDYLQAGAPEAVVQAVLTHCDELLPEGAKDKSIAALEEACAKEINWVKSNMNRHQAQLPSGSKKLLIQDQVPCVCAIAGGDASLTNLRTRLEAIVLAKPPLLPCIGMAIPRTWILAMGFLRALRDGRDPVAVATQNQQPEADSTKAVPYVPLADAIQMWVDVVASRLQVAADGQAIEDTLQVLVNQGEFFASSGIIFLQPDYVTRLLKPLVDHRVGKEANDGKPASGLGGFSILGFTIKDQVRATLLQSAINCFVQSGDLREELLPLLWEPVGLHEDDYGSVLMMLCASGVLFLAEHTHVGRKWVMPMRLPESQPDSQMSRWHRMRTQQGVEQLGLTYPLGSLSIPGITERLMSHLYGFGKYQCFWKGGALIETRVHNAMLLIELRARDVGGDHLNYELAVELRGPKASRSDLFALLLLVRKRTEILLNDFPGLIVAPKLPCPGCLWDPKHAVDPVRWSIEEVCAQSLKCRKCEENIALEGIQLKQSADAEEVSLSLPQTQSTVHNEKRFVGELLRLGTPIEASQGIHKSLGVSGKMLWERFSEGEDAILAEFAQHMSADRDALGWSDGDWLHYLLSQPVDERALPLGYSSTKLDKGHKGMVLDDFVKHPMAVAADLDRPTVLALRLCTTSVYKSINRPLREGRKHPYPALVAHLVNGIIKLRAVQAKKDDGRTTEYWRGLRMEASDEFIARGATDLAFMPTMKTDRKLAERSVSTDGAQAATLLRLQLTASQCGADISWLSCFPGEVDHIFPPGCYIEPKQDRGGARMPGAVKVVDAIVHVKEHKLEQLAPAKQE